MDVICFAHLRWNFVYQRPQHLISRFASVYRVFYIEEPMYTDAEDDYIIQQSKENIAQSGQPTPSANGTVQAGVTPGANGTGTPGSGRCPPERKARYRAYPVRDLCNF